MQKLRIKTGPQRYKHLSKAEHIIVRHTGSRRMRDLRFHMDIVLDDIRDYMLSNKTFRILEHSTGVDITTEVAFDVLKRHARGKIHYKDVQYLLRRFT